MTSQRHGGIGWMLFGMAVLNVVSCASGTVGLLVAGPEMFGEDILAGTLFADQYWLTALALGCVGVSQLVAVVVHLMRSRWVGAGHALAGMTMMVFVFVEVLIIDEVFFLQPLFFAIGALQLSLSPIFLNLLPTNNPTKSLSSHTQT